MKYFLRIECDLLIYNTQITVLFQHKKQNHIGERFFLLPIYSREMIKDEQKHLERCIIMEE